MIKKIITVSSSIGYVVLLQTPLHIGDIFCMILIPFLLLLMNYRERKYGKES